MKNRLLLMLVIALTMFAVNAKAQYETLCPTGYSIVQVPIYVGGCEYTVEICYACGDVVNPATQVSVVWFKKVATNPPCVNGLTTQQILDNIYFQIKDPNYLAYVIGCEQIEPPCGTEELPTYTIVQSVCWKKVLEADDFVQIMACDTDLKCIITYEYCWDSANQILIESIVSKVKSGNSNACLLTELQAGEPTVQNPVTDCFHILTACDNP